MLEQVLTYLNNWFLTDIYEGTYTVQGGRITLPFLQNGQYFRIVGSMFNDGLHQYPAEELTDEEFSGVVWALAVPKAIINTAAEMAEWEAKNSAAVSSPYQSESFGGYSYSKSTGKNGAAFTVFDVFANRLNTYKKTRELGFAKTSKQFTPHYRRPYNPDYSWR